MSTQESSRRTNRYGFTKRGQIPIPPNAHPLVQQFTRIMNEQQTFMKEVSSRSGVSEGALQCWRYKSNPTIDLLDAALNVLDYELVIRPRKNRA